MTILAIQPFKHGGFLNLNKADRGIEGDGCLDDRKEGTEKPQEESDQNDHPFPLSKDAPVFSQVDIVLSQCRPLFEKRWTDGVLSGSRLCPQPLNETYSIVNNPRAPARGFFKEKAFLATHPLPFRRPCSSEHPFRERTLFPTLCSSTATADGRAGILAFSRNKLNGKNVDLS